MLNRFQIAFLAAVPIAFTTFANTGAGGDEDEGAAPAVVKSAQAALLDGGRAADAGAPAAVQPPLALPPAQPVAIQKPAEQPKIKTFNCGTTGIPLGWAIVFLAPLLRRRR